MSPTTPVTFTLPTAPSTYAWEATNEEVARRYGLRPEDIVRFDLNTSPSPPELAFQILAAGRFQVSLSEYPPSDYGLLTAAAAARYGVSPTELVVGAGADEILDLVGKAFLVPGATAVIPSPTYSMYRILSEQREARIVDVPRQPASAGWALDPALIREAALGASVVWLCRPNNPTGTAEPADAIPALLDWLAGDAAAHGSQPPVVVLDEAYAEFLGHSHLDLRETYPNLVVVRTISKAFGLAGLRVGFGIGVPETIARLALYRPPGSVSTVSTTVATEVLGHDEIARANIARVMAEGPRLTAALETAGLRVAPSVTNFVLADLGSATEATRIAEALLRRGLVPRTFGASHPLAGYLRLTVRDRAEDDRLIGAIEEIRGSRPVTPGSEAPRGLPQGEGAR